MSSFGTLLRSSYNKIARTRPVITNAISIYFGDLSGVLGVEANTRVTAITVPKGATAANGLIGRFRQLESAAHQERFPLSR